MVRAHGLGGRGVQPRWRLLFGERPTRLPVSSRLHQLVLGGGSRQGRQAVPETITPGWQ